MVKEILSAIKGACEACVRQEKEERDGIRAQIQQAKVRARADKLPVYHDKRHEERERERERGTTYICGRSLLHTASFWGLDAGTHL